MNARLLIADSDESILPIYARFFAANGCRVEAAKSGLECLDRLRNFLPDAAIIDAHLPWGGGDGVLAAMEDDPALKRIPVVLLDGADLGLDATASERVTHHRRPVRLATLLASVRQAVARQV